MSPEFRAEIETLSQREIDALILESEQRSIILQRRRFELQEQREHLERQKRIAVIREAWKLRRPDAIDIGKNCCWSPLRMKGVRFYPDGVDSWFPETGELPVMPIRTAKGRVTHFYSGGTRALCGDPVTPQPPKGDRMCPRCLALHPEGKE